MSQSFDIAVIGATGTVGETLVQILEERDFPVGTLHLLASSESAGSSVMFRNKNVRVREVDAFDFSKVQLVFFAAGPAVTLSFAPRATAAGCALIDLSGALPPEQAPQVVPEANAQALAGLGKPFQVSSPSASAIALAVALAPLRECLDIQRISLTASLAVSAQGRVAVTELARQTTELLNARPLEPSFFDRQIAFNLLAQVGAPDELGHTQLEKRLVREVCERCRPEESQRCPGSGRRHRAGGGGRLPDAGRRCGGPGRGLCGACARRYRRPGGTEYVADDG
jgi:aspartate-semialdehyde dehydrogenase